ncbi:hypothetical protein [Hymenobacter canadensis]|uniref:HEAT repeat domain-containing protein n=1 Tax=Hymenobacter canadensis TaxID=2999067 RepID=A0ABY7LXN3_9BACT|nr:hypothetical protein [Hymenobacter canadensis]WBA43703.1 hypothetical protein O3303_09060 [Hymenobacter canadensis]
MQKTIQIKRAFRDAIRRGTGRAHLLMRDYPHVNFSLDILKAAVTNYAYDPQCEKGRGVYIVELINLSANKQQLISRILRKLVAQQEDTHGLNQLFEIARLLAQAGHPEARAAFYERLALGALPEYACIGAYEAVLLDGVEGMKRAAEVIGQVLAADPEETEETWLLKYAQEENPDVQVEAELEKAAQHNVHIARYLSAVQETRQRQAQKPPYPSARGFEFVQQLISGKTRRRLNESTVRALSRSQVRQLADAFRVETNSARQGKFLQVFRHVKYPHGYELLLALAAKPPRRNDRPVQDAIQALQFFKAPAIRQFALQALATSASPDLYVDLLLNHYRSGDHKLLAQLARQATSENDIENLASSFIDIYRKHKTRQCLEPLRLIYYRMNCGIHRYDVVKTLLENDVLPNEIREEIVFDSYDDTRKLLTTLQP